MKEFLLPDLGEGLREAEIVAWHVTEGDRVVTDQPLVSVETDKAVVEVPSPRSGVIGLLGAQEGEVIEVGAVLVGYSDDDPVDSGTVVGSMPPSPETSRRSSDRAVDAAVALVGDVPSPPRSKSSVTASPSVRSLARELGVDLATVAPTGQHENVTARDVDSAAERGTVRRQTVPLRGTRRSMAERMADSHSRVAAALAVDEANIGTWPNDVDVTARVIRAIVAGCGAETALNAWFDDEAMTVSPQDRVDLGVAVDSRHGLFTPVIANAGGKDAQELREELGALIDGVKARSLSPQAMRGATLTYSNFGALGGRYAQMMVVPPQVAIVGSGKIREGVVVVEGKIRATRLLPISVTFDHRVITGGEAVRFLRAVIEDLERGE